MIIKRDFIYSPNGKNRPLHIYLPDNYYETDERYPVMYFFDGHNVFFDEDATYGKSWGLKDFLDYWNKKMIIVGIECGHDGYERLGEYLPYKCYGKYMRRFEPLGAKTLEWIIWEIKPVIDREYRTYPMRECTGIAGSSMGGLMALYGVIHHNQWFSKAACVSSAIGFCMSAVMKDLKESAISPDTRVYLSWGTLEAKGLENVWDIDGSSQTYKMNRRVANVLWDRGAAVKLYSQICGGHCEADWEKQVPEFMHFLWME
ncbi:MAG: alpha/beta hydrolase [Lachnospiraceae bacterium]|nr:alpha/beta hydrolase [Lachnospiraceae bacterium]